MIGGNYYVVEVAISDPRQRQVMWRAMEEHKLQADAVSAARARGKGLNQRVRVMKISVECVWANSDALVAMGEPAK